MDLSEPEIALEVDGTAPAVLSWQVRLRLPSRIHAHREMRVQDGLMAHRRI
jgi:hypothetical protein